MYYGLIFIAVEMKALYMIVISAVVNFMKAILAKVYLNMHVKVSMQVFVYGYALSNLESLSKII